MKRKLHYLLMLTCMVACVSIDKVTSKELTGSWLWQSSSGGIAGIIINADPAHARVLMFSKNGRFEEYLDSKLIRESSYQVENGKSITSEEPIPLIHYGNGYISQSFILSGNTLTLFDEVYDGYTSTYVQVESH